MWNKGNAARRIQKEKCANPEILQVLHEWALPTTFILYKSANKMAGMLVKLTNNHCASQGLHTDSINSY